MASYAEMKQALRDRNHTSRGADLILQVASDAGRLDDLAEEMGVEPRDD